MIIIDLPKSESRRVIKGEAPPSRWSWDWMDLVIAVLLLVLFGMLAIVGGWPFVIGGAISVALWIDGFFWRPVGWLVFIGRVAGL
jgi:hypothetical protein